jgi:hypothetical protein
MEVVITVQSGLYSYTLRAMHKKTGFQPRKRVKRRKKSIRRSSGKAAHSRATTWPHGIMPVLVT